MMPLDELGAAILMTVSITGMSLLLGGVAAIPMMLARMSRLTPLRLTARIFIDVVRGVPPVVWVFVVYFGISGNILRLDTFTSAVLSLGLVSAGYLAEIYRGGMLAVHLGQMEAARALAFSPWSGFFRIIFPQAYRVCLPAAATYAIALLKDSSLASAIGASEITSLATSEARASGDGITPFIVAGLLYIALSVPAAYLSRTLDRRMRAKVSAS